MKAEQPEEVRAYLRELESALVGVPAETADEIRAGIEEELTALGPEAARERIRELGDPVYIAAEARHESPGAPKARASSGLDLRTYIVITGLAVAFGIFVVPVVGAIIGFVMMWISPVWKRWEKPVATSIPLLAGALTVAYFGLMRLLSEEGTGSILPGFGAAPYEFSGDVFELLFTPSVTWNALAMIAIANVGVGIWLLIRALRRS